MIDADVYPPEGDDATVDDIDVEFYVDDRDAAALDVDGATATVRLPPATDDARVHAVAVGRRPSVADTVRVTRSSSTSTATSVSPSTVIFVPSSVMSVATFISRLNSGSRGWNKKVLQDAPGRSGGHRDAAAPGNTYDQWKVNCVRRGISL